MIWRNKLDFEGIRRRQVRICAHQDTVREVSGDSREDSLEDAHTGERPER